MRLYMHNYDVKKTTLLWDGRFDAPPSDVMRTYGADASDRRLLSFDIEGSMAHARMLGQRGVLPGDQVEKILRGLATIQREAADGTFAFAPEDEDVHSAVERRLCEIEGHDIGGKLHTGRSRNDQVATDLRLFLRDATDRVHAAIHNMLETLTAKAEAHVDDVVPAYTHLQQAQAVSLAHVLMAYAWMIERDARRFQDARTRIDQSPLGAGACGGSSVPLDPALSAELLGFSSVFDNSLDAVSSRDFASEFAFACAQGMVHLSRLSEDLILWNSKEFGWIRLPDELSTGSSMLPQKKNPDIAELARGRAATALGQLTGLLALQKGLPLSYNRDLQEDKRLVFSCFDTYLATLHALSALVARVEFRPARIDASVLAIDLAERLVGRGVAFREAHRLVGRVVKACETRGIALDQVDADLLHSISDRFHADDLAALDFRASVEARKTQGGGSSRSAEAQIDRMREILRTPRTR